MNVWLIKDGEFLPVQRDVRKMRTWMLAESLVEKGHSVVWWSSTFSHQFKKLLYSKDTEADVNPLFQLRMLYAGAYRKNVSLARILHHWRLGRKFYTSAERLPVPDVIVCAYPTIELAYHVTSYAQSKNVPLIIDIRDQWPSTYMQVSPGFLKPLAIFLVRYHLPKTREVMSKSDRLVSMSEGCLRWGKNLAGRLDETCHKVFYIGYAENEKSSEQSIRSARIRELRDALAGKVVFTFVGSFGFSYQLGLVLDVAERILTNGYANIHFVLAGDGQQFDSLSKRARTLPNVSLPGWLDGHEIHHLLALSHVGLVPVLNFGEGTLPNKPFEYFASGLPVLSSLRGEMEEILSVNEVGFTYDCGDMQGFYDLVIQLASEKSLRKRLGENAMRIYKERFKADVIYTAYASFVEEVAAKKKDNDQASIRHPV